MTRYGEDIDVFEQELLAAGLKTMRLEANGRYGAILTAYDEIALQALLDKPENKLILLNNSWPQKAEAFIRRVHEESVDTKTPLFDLVADAFADPYNTGRTSPEPRPELEGQAAHSKALEFLDLVRSGYPVNTALVSDDFGQGVVDALIPMLTMVEYINLEGVAVQSFRSKPGKLLLQSSENQKTGFQGQPIIRAIWERLAQTLDFSPTIATALVERANAQIMEAIPVNVTPDIQRFTGGDRDKNSNLPFPT